MYKRYLFIGWSSLLLLFTLPALAQTTTGKKATTKPKAQQTQPTSAAAKVPATAETPAAAAMPFGKGAEYGLLQAWAGYDFTPGSKVIFEDYLTGEDQGEFPSQWDLMRGQLETATYGSSTVLNLKETGTIIRPMMLEEKWLPGTATIEMDVLFESAAPGVTYKLYLTASGDKSNETTNGDFANPIEVSAAGLKFMTTDSTSAELKAAPTKFQWRHVSVGLNKNQLDVYLDQYHLLHLTGLKGTPTGLRIAVEKVKQPNTMVRNVFVTEGSNPFPRQLAADSPFVTYGLKFDPYSATMRPESAGTLQRLIQLLQAQPQLKLSIESHTGSLGDENFNLKLSQQRADAVKAYLTYLGIAPERLSAKGWGKAKPLDKSSSEKAEQNNNRIELIKL
ncbi:OmpA family protein [Pontibacter liquoris]|uniref:OmpA family protein n=1 Tax=Pontibacter liquoris TaxID=2905677 RepID=UPI001FA79CED|nr:OmpA family protein [Pontibacter liquoris]